MEFSDHVRKRRDALNKNMGNILWIKTEEMASLIHEYALCHACMIMEWRITDQWDNLDEEMKMKWILELADYIKQLGSKPIEDAPVEKRKPRFFWL